MRDIKLYVSKLIDPTWNLALEQFLFEEKEDNEFIILLWQNDKTVVIGRYQNACEEVDMSYAEEHGITVVRRDTGGGAVYHDLGNINYSFIVNQESEITYCNNVITDVFAMAGVQIEYGGRNDIFVNGYKVSGTAKHQDKTRILYHGTMLLESDLSMLKRVLTRKTKKMPGWSIKSVENVVANLNTITGKKYTEEDIIKFFEKTLGVSSQILQEKDIKCNHRIATLRTQKYANEKWNY